MGIHLRSLIHTRRIKSAKILNPWVLMGLAGSDSNNLQDVLQLWGVDPVHPMETAYTKMAEKIMDEINVTCVMNCRQATSPSAARGQPKHSTMERWTEETPTVGNRMGKWSHGGSRGGNGSAGSGPRGTHRGKRGGRGGHHGKGRWGHGGNRRPY